MSGDQHFEHDPTIDAACESLYRLLSAGLSAPRTEKWRLLLDSENQALARWSADLLRVQFADCPVAPGRGELGIEQLDAAVVLEELTRPDDELAGEHLRVFGMGASDCPPYETEYHSADDTFFRTQQMADVAGFYRAFGLEHSGGSHERADHVSLELEFVSLLLLKKRLARSIEPVNRAGAEQAEICHAARIAFLRDHLCWWTPSFAVALDRKSRGGFYSAVAQLLAALLPVERYRLGIAPPTPPIKPAVEEETSIHECGACALARA